MDQWTTFTRSQRANDWKPDRNDTARGPSGANRVWSANRNLAALGTAGGAAASMTCRLRIHDYGAMVVVVPGSGTNSSGSVVENSVLRSSSESVQAETPMSNVAARVDAMSLRAVCVITTHYPLRGSAISGRS